MPKGKRQQARTLPLKFALIVSTAPHRKPPHQTARRYPTHAFTAILTAGRDCTAVCGCVPRAILRLTNVTRIMLPVDRSCQSRGTKLVVDAPVCEEQNTSRRQSTGARARISMRESCFYIARYHHSRRSSLMLPSVTECFFLGDTAVVVTDKSAQRYGHAGCVSRERNGRGMSGN